MKYKKVNIVFFIIALSTVAALPNVFSQNLPVCWPGGTVQSVSSFRYLPEYNLWSFDPAHDGLPAYGSNKYTYNFTPLNTTPLPFGLGSNEGRKGGAIVSDSIFTWQYVQVQPPYFYSDIFFIDSLYGWGSETYGGVFKTTDSGFNWEYIPIIPAGGSPFRGVHFIDRNTGWVVGSVHKIRKTTNGGFNWIKQDTFYYGIYYNNFNSVHFFNSDTGIIIGERARGYPDTSWGGCVLKTTNGGEDWYQMYSTNDTIYSSTELRRQFWLNKDTGWMVGSNILLKTTDGGLSFTNYYSCVPPTQNGYNVFLDLYFINENTGWLCGSNLDHKNIYKTTNAGLNWIFQDNPVAYYQFPQINGIIFIKGDTGWASSFYGFIIVTTNGGNNWVIDYMGYETSKFASYKNSKVWCGSYGRNYYTLLNGSIGINSNQQILPDNFKLHSNYPNPFNSSTKLRFDLNRKSNVLLKIFDIQGREIEVITNKEYGPGNYELIWNANNYPSGVYLCRCEAREVTEHKESYIKTIKLVLLK